MYFFAFCFRTTDGILKFTELGCCHAAVIGSGIFQFSQAQVNVFLLKAFVYFSFLAHFAITSLVVFAELSILLRYEVIVLKFYLQSFNLRLIYAAILFVPAQFGRSCQSFLISFIALNFTFLHSISLFCTGEIALFTDLGLIDMFSNNQNAEIVACILLAIIQ